MHHQRFNSHHGISLILLAAMILLLPATGLAQSKPKISVWETADLTTFDKDSHSKFFPKYFQFFNLLKKPDKFEAPDFQNNAIGPRRVWTKGWRYSGNKFFSAYMDIQLYDSVIEAEIEFDRRLKVMEKERGFQEDTQLRDCSREWSNVTDSYQYPVKLVYSFPSLSHVSHTLLAGPFVVRLNVRANRMQPTYEKPVLWLLSMFLRRSISNPPNNCVLIIARKDPQYGPAWEAAQIPKDPNTQQPQSGVRINGLVYLKQYKGKAAKPFSGADIFSFPAAKNGNLQSGPGGKFGMTIGNPPKGAQPIHVKLKMLGATKTPLMDLKVQTITQKKISLNTFSGVRTRNLGMAGGGAFACGPVTKSPPSKPGPFPFDGKNHLQMEDSMVLCPTDAFSLGADFHPSSSNESVIASNAIANSRDRGFDFSLKNQELIFTLFDHKGFQLSVKTKTKISKGPHHLLVSYDGSRVADGVRLYVDAKPVALTVLSSKLTGSTRTDRPVLIGKRPNEKVSFVGQMPLFALFDQALSPEEVKWVVSNKTTTNAGVDPLVVAPSGGGTPGGATVGWVVKPTQPRSTAIAISSASKAQGDTVAIPVTVYNLSKLGDLNLTIRYPANLVQLVGFTKGIFARGTIFDANTAKPGEIKLGLANQKGLDGSFVLGRMDFKLLGKPGSKANVTSQVTIATQVGTETPIRFALTNGVITIASGRLKGDWNGDGQTTSLDALAALRMSVDKLKEDLILDIDNDGHVTAKDARLLLGMAVGIGISGGGTSGGGTPSGGTPSGGTSGGGTPGGGTPSGGTPSGGTPSGGTPGGGTPSGGTPGGGTPSGGTPSGGTPSGGTPSGGTPGGGTPSGGTGIDIGQGVGPGVVINGDWDYLPVYTANINNLGLAVQHPMAWNSNGKNVFFSTYGRGENIWRFDLDTWKLKTIISTVPDPVLDIKTMRMSSSRLQVLGSNVVYLYTYSYSVKTPDGKFKNYNIRLTVPMDGGKPKPFLISESSFKYYLVALRDTPPAGLYTEAAPLGGRTAKLFTAPGLPPNFAARKPYLGLPKNTSNWLAISRDWTRIAKVIKDVSGDLQIAVYDLPGKLIVTFPDSLKVRSADFSPDGSHLVVCEKYNKSSTRLVIIPLATPDKRYIVFDKGNCGLPAWSPDGRHIAFGASYDTGIQFGHMQTQKKFHIIRILPPKGAAYRKDLDKRIAAAKAAVDIASKHSNSVSHDPNQAKIAVAEKKWTDAKKVHDDLLLEMKNFCECVPKAASGGTPSGGLPSGGTKLPQPPALNYSGALGTPKSLFERFTTNLYRSTLHRNPTADEIYHCLKVLKIGKARYKETLTMLHSEKYKARKTTDKQFIRDTYQAMLGREPYKSETKILLEEMKKGTSRISIVGLIIATDEHKKIREYNGVTKP